jgi:hypothetical protein
MFNNLLFKQHFGNIVQYFHNKCKDNVYFIRTLKTLKNKSFKNKMNI